MDRPATMATRSTLAKQGIRTETTKPSGPAVVQVPVKDIVEAQGTEAARKDMLAEDVAAKVAEIEKEKGEAFQKGMQEKEMQMEEAYEDKMVPIRLGEEEAKSIAIKDAWKGLGTGLRIGVPIAVGGIVAALSISIIWGSLKSVSVDFSALPEEQQYVIIAIIGVCIFAVVAYLTWKYMGEH